MATIICPVWGVSDAISSYDYAAFELESPWDPSVPNDRPRRLRPIKLKPVNVRKPLPDFAVPGNRNLVAREPVAQMLIRGGLQGINLDPVYFVKHARGPEGKRVKQTLPCPMVEIVLDDVDPDFGRCTTRIETVDGQPRRLFEGHEVVSCRYDQNSKELIVTRTPRQAGRGRVFLQQALGERDIFREGFTGHVMCTDRFKRLVEARNLGGLEFREMGDLIADVGEPLLPSAT